MDNKQLIYLDPLNKFKDKASLSLLPVQVKHLV